MARKSSVLATLNVFFASGSLFAVSGIRQFNCRLCSELT